MGDEGTSDGPPDLYEIVDLELQLLDPAVRRSEDAVMALLHPSFLEFGASGRSWSAAAVTASIVAAAADGERVEGRNFAVDQLADGVVLLTYEAHSPGRVCLRSSVWVRVADRWQLRFHQGTVAAP